MCAVLKAGKKLVGAIELACNVVGFGEKTTGGGEGDSTSDGTNGDVAHAGPPEEKGVAATVARTAMDVKEFINQMNDKAAPEEGRVKEAKSTIIGWQMSNLQHLAKQQSDGVANPINLVKSAEVRAPVLC